MALSDLESVSDTLVVAVLKVRTRRSVIAGRHPDGPIYSLFPILRDRKPDNLRSIQGDALSLGSRFRLSTWLLS